MKYPVLLDDSTIGITPVSNGIFSEAEDMFNQAFKRMEERGFKIVLNEDIWGQEKARAASAEKRAAGLADMMADPNIDVIMPPWGGHLALEILEHLDFDTLQVKWLTGYSDISTILLAITLKTGIATAHMANIVDLRGRHMDKVTARWLDVLSCQQGAQIIQTSSERYQLEWDHEHPTDIVFNLTEKTKWKAVDEKGQDLSEARFEGRVLGGCIDTMRHLIGTSYGDIPAFREKHTEGEDVLWYIDVSELDTVDLKRSLTQMKYAGWFESTAGLIFGRVGKPSVKEDYTYKNVYQDIARELGKPVIYDVDFGHKPPQMAIINGAYGMIEMIEDKGQLIQRFK
ncbi:LD-carboxypeptidase [Macrococcus brunensis]|uniref:LD-carboxypeptidase n=2 Tax=Macrococcus brunensis TaxID=198483 RepID=A0A4R6BE16_9STAP|nr:S66 peptidase family protein [Macrococcus brunensis]TDL98024.1 LD-carboxypeptidase [Macrococcus brunensis]